MTVYMVLLHPLLNPVLTKVRISVTNLQTSPTLLGLDMKHALVEQQAMAKENKPDNQDGENGSDPIAAALKQMHDAVVSEDLPDDFLRLLDEIDTKIASKKATH
jgi:Anti-sigma factor NepR